MTRAFALCLICLASPGLAATWTCQTALEQQADGRLASSYAIDVRLEPHGAFTATGHQRDGFFDYPIAWSGTYTRFDNRFAMIGALKSGGWFRAFETRALSTRMEPDVMVLTLSGAPLANGPMRCLRKDTR